MLERVTPRGRWSYPLDRNSSDSRGQGSVVHWSTIILITMYPKMIFKLDGIGAGISLLLTLVLLLPLNHLFEFQPIYLVYLMVYAAFLTVYDFFCWHTADVRWKPKVKVLIMLNTFFMLVGAAVLLHQEYRPGVLGVIYLLGEIAIVFILTIMQGRYLIGK